jgi:hypothetical protein
VSGRKPGYRLRCPLGTASANAGHPDQDALNSAPVPRALVAAAEAIRKKVSGKTRTEVKDKLKLLDAVPGLINRARSPPAPLTALLYTITQGG